MRHSLTSSHYSDACSIPDPDTDTVLVTGGYKTPTIVSRYGKEGWREDFSSGLKTGRYRHGCSSFLSRNNERVIKSFEFKRYYSKVAQNWRKTDALHCILRHFGIVSKTPKKCVRCCWSLGAYTPLDTSSLTLLRCITPLLGSGERSLELCPGQCSECLW